MKFSMTGQENGDLLIQVTALAGFTVSIYIRERKKFIVLTTDTYRFVLIINYECIHTRHRKFHMNRTSFKRSNS
jgi:uncharacterized membrane protein